MCTLSPAEPLKNQKIGTVDRIKYPLDRVGKNYDTVEYCKYLCVKVFGSSVRKSTFSASSSNNKNRMFIAQFYCFTTVVLAKKR